MIDFCADVKDWLKADDNNIIAVHCKGGKGRTGTMICTWLIHTELFEQAKVQQIWYGKDAVLRSWSPQLFLGQLSYTSDLLQSVSSRRRLENYMAYIMFLCGIMQS